MYLMKDLFKEDKAIDFQKAWYKGREIDKKYYFVPLKLVKTGGLNNHNETVEYEIDHKLL